MAEHDDYDLIAHKLEQAHQQANNDDSGLPVSMTDRGEDRLHGLEQAYEQANHDDLQLRERYQDRARRQDHAKPQDRSKSRLWQSLVANLLPYGGLCFAPALLFIPVAVGVSFYFYFSYRNRKERHVGWLSMTLCLPSLTVMLLLPAVMLMELLVRLGWYRI